MHPLLARNLKQTIKAGELALTPLPLCPTISLYLISDDYPTGRLPQDEMLAIIDKPAYWAFCWASGQVLAGYITQHPEICRDKSVLDLGSGSGVVAIAAAQAGATNVIACDIDAHALDATRV
jgi:predicted nicotinamide N-methyase